MNVSKFFKEIYDEIPPDLYLLLWKPQGKQSFYFQDFEQAARFVKNNPNDVYFQVCLSPTDFGRYNRCKANEVAAIPGLWADIDYGRKKYPPRLDDAMSLITGNGFDPNIVVHTGGGLHAYWLFKELLIFENDEERIKVAHMSKRLQKYLESKASEKGWEIDKTGDLARILRPVQTWNCKNGSKLPVKIHQTGGTRYQGIQNFDEFLPEYKEQATKPVDITPEIYGLNKNLIFNPNAGPADDLLDILFENDLEFERLWHKKYKPGKDTTPSGWEFDICKKLTEAKFDDQTILDFCIAFRRNHGHALDLNNKQKYTRTIINARKAVEKPKYKAKENEIFKALSRNQDGDAELYIKQNKDRFIYDHCEKHWYIWQDHFWKKDFRKCALRAVDEAIKVYEPYAKTNDKVRDRVNKLRSLTRKRQVLELASIGNSGLGLDGTEWDCKPYLLPCLNGVVDLKTGKFSPGKPEQYMRTYCPIAYNPEAPEPIEFIQFLTDIYGGNKNVDAMISYTKRLLGMALIGEQIEHCLIVFYGRHGRNGKTVLFEVLTDILGPFVINFGPNFLTSQAYKRDRDAAKPSIVAMRGRRLVFTAEANKDTTFDATFIKEITGGGTQEGRSLFEGTVNFKPAHTVFLATNKRPKANYNDSALWYRMHTIELHRSFVENPQKPWERQRNIHIKSIVLKEAESILKWIIDGCLEYQRRGSLAKPDEVIENTNKHRMRQDQIRSFVFDRIKREGKIYANALYEAYLNWADNNQYAPMSQALFGRKIKDFIEYGDDKKGVWYKASLKQYVGGFEGF